MKTLTVDLGDRSYPIYIGQGLLSQNLLAQHIRGQQVMVVSNETVAPLYMDKVLSQLEGFEVGQVILPDGEIYKTTEVLNQVYDGLLSGRFDRKTTLIALGGGVVGDMTGFAAACYQRGVDFIQIPTTLLAQVDSSVGGKTGVNHPKGKNMIGAFYQPQCVLCDTDTLNTLEDRQLSAGLAEVIKYGIIRDREFFDWLVAHAADLVGRDPEALSYAIERSCQNKADVVVADEREAGVRALLNLGHTFGHAIETAEDYRGLLHGEAVAVGMCLAAQMSEDMGWIDSKATQEVEQACKALQLPTAIPQGLKAEDLIEHMQVDKKVDKGRVRLILLKAVGDALMTGDYPDSALSALLACHCQA